MNKPIIIIGAGENSKVISSILHKNYSIYGFLDDKKKDDGVIGPISDYKNYIRTHSFFVSIGSNLSRSKVIKEIKNRGGTFVNTIHKKSLIEKNVIIGNNIFIGANSYININSVLEDAVFINNGCLVEHDNIIKCCAHLAPGVITGGGVQIGSRSFIGLGTTINDHISIDNDTIIGSGSVVTENIPKHVMAAGAPVKIIKNI